MILGWVGCSARVQDMLWAQGSCCLQGSDGAWPDSVANSAGLVSACCQVETQFKILWADHGDDIARQYAGTGALKSGFTRTGAAGLPGRPAPELVLCGHYCSICSSLLLGQGANYGWTSKSPDS